MMSRIDIYRDCMLSLPMAVISLKCLSFKLVYCVLCKKKKRIDRNARNYLTDHLKTAHRRTHKPIFTSMPTNNAMYNENAMAKDSIYSRKNWRIQFVSTLANIVCILYTSIHEICKCYEHIHDPQHTQCRINAMDLTQNIFHARYIQCASHLGWNLLMLLF